MAAAPAPDGSLKVPDDAELARRLAAGDRSAFDALVARHARYLHGVARSLVANPADAEDVVQETLIGALKSRFRGESSVRTWLVKILVRQAALLRRSKWRWLMRWTGEEGAEPARQSSDSASDARIDLVGMLEALSPEHREIIVLRELEGLSYQEIAEVLQVPQGTVESRLFRARRELQARFAGYLSR